MMRKHPRCIGGFLWVLADEGVKRVDMNNFIDNQGNFGADGIVGPHHEKEGGWHGKYDTPTGVKLIKSMVERDVNHPSVIWWSNGNEKGWNTELDGEFHKHDPQKRPVIHPQGNFSGFETMHYRSYGESQEYMRLPEIFMPTEFLHGLYDGGHGAAVS